MIFQDEERSVDMTKSKMDRFWYSCVPFAADTSCYLHSHVGPQRDIKSLTAAVVPPKVLSKVHFPYDDVFSQSYSLVQCQQFSF